MYVCLLLCSIHVCVFITMQHMCVCMYVKVCVFDQDNKICIYIYNPYMLLYTKQLNIIKTFTSSYCQFLVVMFSFTMKNKIKIGVGVLVIKNNGCFQSSHFPVV